VIRIRKSVCGNNGMGKFSFEIVVFPGFHVKNIFWGFRRKKRWKHSAF
jgi:hypothetical protein